MHISEKGIQLIKNFEGCSLKSYKCPAGVITLGYGHTGTYKGKPLTLGMTITQQEADDLLKQDLIKYENYVNSLHRDFNQHEYDALCSFVYNCGIGSLTTLCRGRNNEQIGKALTLYNKAGGKVLAGLTRRRKAEQELYFTPVTNTFSEPKLPYKVKTKCDLNIRSAASASSAKIRVAKKGEILTVWAVETNGTTKWGRNGREYFSLAYCELV